MKFNWGVYGLRLNHDGHLLTEDNLEETSAKLIDEIRQIDKLLHENIKALGGDMPMDNVAETTQQPLNQILFGPPGTGKTYHSVNKALAILEPGTDWDNTPREEALARYNALKEEGRIVFTTFHQSMSYEDFIEGIKPVMGTGGVGYDIEDGVFKRIVNVALRNYYGMNNSRLDGKMTEDEHKNLVDSITKKEVLYVGTGEGDDEPFEEQFPEPCPYVLIIDEINRGNIANIFGELITLIEDDKRLGRPEAVSVTLPYSKQTFCVPDNLYIIGTMNTADRSVEALDSALRRRFEFEEMMPNARLLSGVMVNSVGKTLQEILDTINERIEVLKDREHQKGHSYFMGYAKSLSVDPEDLKEVFKKKILPLLQEYFYGDYEKIQLVLGKGFVEQKTQNVTFAQGSSNIPDLMDRYGLVEDVRMESALKSLMNISEG